MSEEGVAFTRKLQELAEEYENLRQSRHAMGQEKYGPFSFLERDTVQDVLEEIADAGNYLLYLYIKIRLIESAYNVPPTDKLGVEAFQTIRNMKDK